MRYNHIPTRIAKTKKNDIPTVGKIVTQLDIFSNIAHMNAKW